MGRVGAYHDGRLSGFHHRTSECSVGQLIPRDRRLLGTGGKPLCEECRTLLTVQEQTLGTGGTE